MRNQTYPKRLKNRYTYQSSENYQLLKECGFFQRFLDGSAAGGIAPLQRQFISVVPDLRLTTQAGLQFGLAV